MAADEDFESFELTDPGESSPFIPLNDDEKTELRNEDAELQMDSGLVAWVQCASSFCLSMGTWGVGNSYGTQFT